MSARAVRLTGPGRVLLERIAEAENPIYVMRDPGGHLGNGVNRATYDRVRRDGLVELGPYVATLGRPLLLTQPGRAALEAPVQTPRPVPRLIR